MLSGNGAERQGGGIAVADQGRVRAGRRERLQRERVQRQRRPWRLRWGRGGDGGEAPTLRRSLLRNNVANLGGAAAVSGTLLVENSTLTANQALRGAGIFSVGQGRLVSSTVARNLVSTVEGETGGASGIELDHGARLTVANSIVALGRRWGELQGSSAFWATTWAVTTAVASPPWAISKMSIPASWRWPRTAAPP